MDADQAADAFAAHAVLFFADLFMSLWPWLDRASKQALRCVNGAMRSQVDASIKVVTSPSSRFSAAQLIHALSNWPGVRDLTLLGVSGDSDLQPLATVSLAGLTSLTVRQAGLWEDGGTLPRWGITLSSNMGATLRLIDVSCCRDLGSIDVVHSCAELRCLWMPFCFSVSDFSPLAACSETLEELWMASTDVVSLSLLKTCTKLRKLDLRDCGPDELYDQAEDLQLTCTQLAAPSSVEVEGLVHELQPNMPPAVQEHAAYALAVIIDDEDVEASLEAQDANVVPGAIPALVQMLGPDWSADVQAAAAFALGTLADGHAQNQSAISDAGAIPLLVQLLGPDCSARVQEAAANALGFLAANNAENQAFIAVAGAIPALVQLLGPDHAEDVAEAATITLHRLAANKAANTAAIVALQPGFL
ncbi:hypothetical protein FOA52_010945 [Chlamydomonas sp. UWO 241]|nr:hypothetical protein FOA52_010945 [Chlamydomonas sp. UWO 241]